jgi:hypothetical protein
MNTSRFAIFNTLRTVVIAVKAFPAGMNAPRTEIGARDSAYAKAR